MSSPPAPSGGDGRLPPLPLSAVVEATNTDDYELGLVIGHVLKADRPHLVDPAMMESIGRELRPVLTDLTNTLSQLVAVFLTVNEE